MNTIPPNVKNEARQDDRRDADDGDDKKGRKDPSPGKDNDEDKDEDMDNVVSQRSVK